MSCEPTTNENSRTTNFPVFLRWTPATVLRVSGEDAASFLQGQFSNDLRELDRKKPVYGLWLNHKGRVIADSFVHRLAEGDFLVFSYHCPVEVIRPRLEAFVIADDVVLEDVTLEWGGITVLGPETHSVYSNIVSALQSEGISFSGRRTARPHLECVFPRRLESAAVSMLTNVPEISEAEAQLIRIVDGIPSVPADIGPSELPNEGGLEGVAISYTKGCYLGQEVIARLKSMGQVRRRLLRVQGTGALPLLPASLFQGERRIGELRTIARTAEGFLGFVLVSLVNLQLDTGLSFSPGGEVVMKLMEKP